jgi:hypothetical protein
MFVGLKLEVFLGYQGLYLLNAQSVQDGFLFPAWTGPDVHFPFTRFQDAPLHFVQHVPKLFFGNEWSIAVHPGEHPVLSGKGDVAQTEMAVGPMEHRSDLQVEGPEAVLEFVQVFVLFDNFRCLYRGVRTDRD